MKQRGIRCGLLLLALIGLLGILFACSGPSNEGTETENPDKTLHYTMNLPKSGFIKGKRTQTPDENGMYMPVTATAQLGYRFVGWSDGVTEPTRQDSVALGLNEVTALFEYDILDMPIVVLTTSTGKDVESKETYIGGSICILDVNGKVQYESEAMEIRGRGNSTWNMEKKAYRIKLEKKENLLNIGEGKAKSWVLLANHCDHSLQRVGLAFRMAGMLDGFDYVPGYQWVEVYLNGTYRGVYLLTEQTQVENSRVDIDDTDFETNVKADFLIEKTAWDFDYGFTVKGERYGIKSDLSAKESVRNQQIEWIDKTVTAAYDAMVTGNKATIEALMDLDSLIDDYLLQEITKNFDVGFDSFYLYYTDGKLRFGPPWDFDLSLGNANLGFENTSGLTAAVHPTNPEFDTSNPWFYQMMKHGWFRAMVVERWNEVKGKISTLPATVQTVGTQYNRSFCRNFEKWNIFGQNFARTTDALLRLTTYDQHSAYLSDWLTARIAWLDACYSSKDFAKGNL